MSQFSTFSLLFFMFTAVVSWYTPHAKSEWIPTSEFVRSLQTAVNVTREVSNFVQRLNSTFSFGNLSRDSRLRNAIEDCLGVLALSADELKWSLSASHNARMIEISGLLTPLHVEDGESNVSDDLISDLRTWVSAMVVNHDTCIDGLEGTIVKDAVANKLNQIIPLMKDLLKMLDSNQNSKSTGGGIKDGLLSPWFKNAHVPSWLRPEDRKLLGSSSWRPDVVVAADGSGNFFKVMDAVNTAPSYGNTRYVIYVKKGVYHEYVKIRSGKTNLVIVGDGMDATIITGNRNVPDGWTTYSSATFAVEANRFIAQDISFVNTAGPYKYQAVALRSNSDQSIFYRCGIKGYQDTLFSHSKRQLYLNCHISGTVDFIFGSSRAVFQNCDILARVPLRGQKNTITAHGGIAEDTGIQGAFSIQYSRILADSDLSSRVNSVATYLGRPWKSHARTVFMQSYISDVVRPEGWLGWGGTEQSSDVYYAEFQNSGPGSNTDERVNWPGYHGSIDAYEAAQFTVDKLIDGTRWVPSYIKYRSGL